MTTLQINGQTYFCPCDWSELKWSQFIALKRFDPCAETLSRIKNNNLQKTNASKENEQLHEDTCVEKEAELLSLFCGIDPDIALRIDPADRKRFVACLIRRFITPLRKVLSPNESNVCDNDTLIPDSMVSEGYEFRCGDESLHLPKSERTFEGASLPLCDVSAVQWCEATDLYLVDKWEYAPLIAAVLCKGDESGYIERIVKGRAELMRDLYMDIIAALFVALNETHRKMTDLYPECYTKKSNTSCPSENTSDFSWNELLLWAGHFKADEIERVRSMNCYDFMALVNGRIKSGNC